MTAPPPDCLRHRASLSALLDGAASEADAVAVHNHLASCAACQAYRTRLDHLAALVAAAAVPAAPDLLPRLAPVMADLRPQPGRAPRPSLARHLLGSVGAAQVTLGLPALLAGWGADDVHTSRHLGAWAVAFGVGLLLAAVRPRHARTLLPIAATLALAVAATSVIDLVAGDRAAGAEAAHVLEIIGLALLVLVHRETQASTVAEPPPSALSLAGGG